MYHDDTLCLRFVPETVIIASTVPGLPPDEACEASRLAEGLTNAAIFLLMAMESFREKGSVTRILHKSALERRKSIVGPLATAGTDVDGLLKSLESSGYVRGSWGMRAICCTREGDVVKHRFNLLAVFLRVHRTYPQIGSDSVADVDKLRDYMRRVCERRPL